MRYRKKRPVTLIEIMIVILLIGLIGGALAFNMRGSMDQGRAFKTKQNMGRVAEAIMLRCANGDYQIEELASDSGKEKIKQILKECPFIKDGEKLLKDAWGYDLTFSINDNELIVKSAKLDDWEANHGKS